MSHIAVQWYDGSVRGKSHRKNEEKIFCKRHSEWTLHI